VILRRGSVHDLPAFYCGVEFFIEIRALQFIGVLPDVSCIEFRFKRIELFLIHLFQFVALAKLNRVRDDKAKSIENDKCNG
jgi:hypothetical protein